MWELTLYREGVTASYFDGDLVSTGVYMLGRATSWDISHMHGLNAAHRSFVGMHIWSSPGTFWRLGITYPALLVVLVVNYILVHRWGRRKRKATLQRRLQDTQQEHIRENA